MQTHLIPPRWLNRIAEHVRAADERYWARRNLDDLDFRILRDIGTNEGDIRVELRHEKRH